MNRQEMVWEEPPMPNHGYDWESVARLLLARPGEWLKLFDEGPISIANAIRGSGIRALSPYVRPGMSGTGFNVRTRNNNRATGTCTLYLRYVEERDGSAASGN